jgi:hypothetical protein
LGNYEQVGFFGLISESFGFLVAHAVPDEWFPAEIEGVVVNIIPWLKRVGIGGVIDGGIEVNGFRNVICRARS